MLVSNLSAVVHLGYRNYLLTHRIVAVMDSALTPTRKIIARLKADPNNPNFINMTGNKKARALIILDNGMYLLCWKPVPQIVSQIEGSTQHEDEPEARKKLSTLPKERRLGAHPTSIRIRDDDFDTPDQVSSD